MDYTAHAAEPQRLDSIHQPGEVREIRVFAPSGKYTALFTDLKWVYEQAIPAIERTGAGAYFTLNPVDARPRPGALHTFLPAFKTTGDGDILRRTRMLVDLDPKRPAGTSATDEEKKPALERAGAIADGLARRGWPEPMLADSGNGYHLIYKIDLPNDPESRELVRTCLEALAYQAGSERVDVDRSVFNASRITTLYGTTKRKGEDTPERPHRKSGIISVPEPFEIVSREMLEALAAWAPAKPAVERPEYTGPTEARLDLDEWLARHGILILNERSWTNYDGDPVTIIEIPCPFSPEDPHGGSQVFVWQNPDGKLCATCHHNRCAGKAWRDLRARYEPGYGTRSLNRTRTYAVRKETIPDA